MANSVAVTPGAGFAGATAVLNPAANDTSGFVTFTTASTIPGSGPYLLFTLTWASSWNSTYVVPQAVTAFACALFTDNLTAAQVMAAAALGPYGVLPSAGNITAAVYCTNAPAITTAYDIAYTAIQGP